MPDNELHLFWAKAFLLILLCHKSDITAVGVTFDVFCYAEPLVDISTQQLFKFKRVMQISFNYSLTYERNLLIKLTCLPKYRNKQQFRNVWEYSTLEFETRILLIQTKTKTKIVFWIQLNYTFSNWIDAIVNQSIL